MTLPKALSQNIVVQNLKDETLIYNLSTHKAFRLNGPAAVVWENCDGVKTVGEIAGVAERKFNHPVSEDFVWLAIEQLKKDELLVGELPKRFAGVGRREVIKSIGLAAVIALPLVTSVAAPGAAGAASICAFPTDPAPPACVSTNTIFNFGCAVSIDECTAKVDPFRTQYCCLGSGRLYEASGRCRLNCTDF